MSSPNYEAEYQDAVAAYARHLGHAVPADATASHVEVTSSSQSACNTCDAPAMVNGLSFTPVRTVTEDGFTYEQDAGPIVFMYPFDLADFTRFVTAEALKPKPAEPGGDWCTDISARWCPACGDCICPRDEDEADLDDHRPDGLCTPGCPLHDPDSQHAEETR